MKIIALLIVLDFRLANGIIVSLASSAKIQDVGCLSVNSVLFAGITSVDNVGEQNADPVIVGGFANFAKNIHFHSVFAQGHKETSQGIEK